MGRPLLDVADAHAIRVEELVLRRGAIKGKEIEHEQAEQDHRQSQVLGHRFSFVMSSRGGSPRHERCGREQGRVTVNPSPWGEGDLGWSAITRERPL